MSKNHNFIANTILAIDSSSGACSVAVMRGGVVCSYIEELSASMQAKRLVNMVEEALAESTTSYAELEKIAVTIGPGSFTGIRIALATARGIGFATQLPVLGFSGLLVMAYDATISPSSPKNQQILAVLNAGKGELIYQNFSAKLEALCPPTLGKPDEIKNLVTDKTTIIGYNSDSSINFPRADLLAMLASQYPDRAVAPLPFYVRPPDAKLPNS